MVGNVRSPQNIIVVGDNVSEEDLAKMVSHLDAQFLTIAVVPTNNAFVNPIGTTVIELARPLHSPDKVQEEFFDKPVRHGYVHPKHAFQKSNKHFAKKP